MVNASPPRRFVPGTDNLSRTRTTCVPCLACNDEYDDDDDSDDGDDDDDIMHVQHTHACVYSSTRSVQTVRVCVCVL